MIGIIDYGMGNLRSVQKALEFQGFQAFISKRPEEILKAEKIILPGVGAFEQAIGQLRLTGMDRAVQQAVKAGRPLLGICLGMQLLFEKSYENGVHEGLGILKGEIVRFSPHMPEKIPHIGWNSLQVLKEAPLFAGVAPTPYVYFVHSYHLKTTDDIVCATTFYGEEIQVAAQRENVYAVQFHPEKSGDLGLRILKNFATLKS